MAEIYEKIKQFFKKNEFRIALFLGLILVATISFEAGLISAKNKQNSPLVIEKITQIKNWSSEGASGSLSEAQNSVQEAKDGIASPNIPAQNLSADKQNCAYVGSKNSNKYHMPTCRFAKLIKPKNIVCFSSVEDATTKGYLPDKGCIK